MKVVPCLCMLIFVFSNSHKIQPIIPMQKFTICSNDSLKYKHREQKNYSSKDDENDLDNNDEDDDEVIFGERSEVFKHCDLFSFLCVQCETLNFWNLPWIFNEVSAFFCIQ